MSDAPQQTGPDLHAIFGMDDEDPGDHVVELERAGADDEDAAAIEPAGDPLLSLEVPDGASEEPPSQSGEWAGITRPSRRGSSSRFLTDVIVDMGLASRGQVRGGDRDARAAWARRPSASCSKAGR